MVNNSHRASGSGQPRRMAPSAERGHEQKGIAVCPTCKNVHHNKRWSRPSDYRVSEAHKDGLSVRSEVCPACKMIERHQFEGEVIVEKVPKEEMKELKNLIVGFGARATERDPQDRIIAIEPKKDGYRVTTTENQLAVKLSKKIKDAFNHVRLDISYSKEPDEVDRVKVTFE